MVALLQIPLLGLRWCEVLDALALRNRRVTRKAVLGVTAIGAFFTQVLPNVAGEGMRIWYLARLGCDWRNGVISVLIDRGVGIGLMVAFAVAILLVPSPLTALAGYGDVVLAIYGALLLAGILGLVFAAPIAAVLRRWRSGWFAAAALDARRAILGPRGAAIVAIGCCVHALTVLIVWLLGQAQGLALSPFDAAVLFVVMIGIALVPISIGGWGLREFAVVAVMADYGLSPERALLFSVCFGLVLVAGALPGALVWLLYSVPPAAVRIMLGSCNNGAPVVGAESGRLSSCG